MKKTAFTIMLITIISKMIGFGREILLSYFFGASSISDAYLISLTIPSVIFGFIGAGIGTSYIPMQTRVMEESGNEAGSKFTSNFVNLIMLITTLLFIVTMVYTEPIVKLFASGFSDETLLLTVKFMKISLFGMYFSALVSIFSGYLQIKNRYIVPTLMGLPLNIIIIISIILASKGNYIILVVGTLFATASQFLFMLPFIKKEKFIYKFSLNLRDDRIIKTMYLALPVIIGTSINQINILVDRTIASSLAIGGISALNYANRLIQFILGLFVSSIITVMYPMISSYAIIHNYEGIKKTIGKSIIIITIFLLPMTIGAMIFNDEIITFLFGRGAFDDRAIKMTSLVLFFYAIGMIGFGLREVLARGFYSLQNTKTPMINAALGLGLNIILNIVLSQFLGVGGLALATSISALFTTLLLFISLRKRLGPFGLKQISTSVSKIFIASIIMGILAKLCFIELIGTFSLSISLILSICFGSISYFIAIYFMKIEDIALIVTLIKNKIYKN